MGRKRERWQVERDRILATCIHFTTSEQAKAFIQRAS